MPVVDETTGTAARPYHVRIHDSAYATRRFDLLIQNLEAQTDLDAVLDRLAAEAKPGDLVMTLGAGSISTLGARLVQRLREDES